MDKMEIPKLEAIGFETDDVIAASNGCDADFDGCDVDSDGCDSICAVFDCYGYNSEIPNPSLCTKVSYDDCWAY